ncbi:hypothetical protein JCM11251_006811 [Rhodosporidiobolus azoricus]
MAYPPSLTDSPSLRTRASSPAAQERVVRSASASSAAGNATFTSAFPPMPKRESRMRAEGSNSDEEVEKALLSNPAPSPPPRTRFPTLRHLLRRARRTPRLSLALLSFTLLLLFLLSRLIPPTLDLLHMWHYKLIDRAYDSRWGWPLAPPCSMRKRPVVFVRGEDKAAIVWETNECGEDSRWRLRWGKQNRALDGKGGFEWHAVEPIDVFALADEEGGGRRVVHSAAFEDMLEDQLYEWEVSRCTVPLGACQPIAQGTFPWLGRPTSPLDPAPSSSTTIHIACIADNQFNLRVFRRILLRLRFFARSTFPSSYFSDSPPLFPTHRPHLLLHAGDAVQNPHDLAQWQTDFWDPLTRTFSASSSLLSSLFQSPVTTSTLPPVLLARGNHDWDVSGQNLYTGGLAWQSTLRADYSAYLSSANPPLPRPDDDHSRRGTYYSYSSHSRFRILVLDSNLPTLAEQEEQERWLLWEVGGEKWTRASIRAVVVHTAPWIEWWDRRAWTEGGESEWSAYVRRSLMPILAQHGCNLVLSGHSHAYTRGFLPYSLVPAYSSATSSSGLSGSVLAAARSASVFPPEGEEAGNKAGMLLITFGGAGGSLDSDRVEEWGFMDRSISGRYHFGWLAASFADENREASAARELKQETKRRKREGERRRVFSSTGAGECAQGKEVRDVVEWRAIGVEGEEVDRVWLVSTGCANA